MPKLNLKHNLPLFIALLVVTASIPLTAFVALTQRSDTRSRAGGGFPEQPPLTYAVTEIGTIIPWGGNVLGVQQIAAIPQGEIPEATPTIRPRPPTPTPTSTPTPTPTSCEPRPGCIDSTPRCLIPEPAGGWCPPSPTSTSTSSATPAYALKTEDGRIYPLVLNYYYQSMYYEDPLERVTPDSIAASSGKTVMLEGTMFQNAYITCSNPSFCYASTDSMQPFTQAWYPFPNNLPFEVHKIHSATKINADTSINSVNPLLDTNNYKYKTYKANYGESEHVYYLPTPTTCSTSHCDGQFVRSSFTDLKPFLGYPVNLHGNTYEVSGSDIFFNETKTNYPSPYPTFTPTPTMTSCKTGVDSFGTSNSCGDNMYRQATYTCYDGTYGLMGGQSACQSYDYWKDAAYRACINKPPCPISTPTLTPTPSISPTPTVSPAQTDLFFNPPQLETYTDGKFSTQLMMNTNQNQITSANLVLEYNTDAIEITSVVPTSVNFPDVLKKPTIDKGQIKVDLGTGVNNRLQGQNLFILTINGKTKKTDGQYGISVASSSLILNYRTDNNVLRSTSFYLLNIKKPFPGDTNGNDEVDLRDYNNVTSYFRLDLPQNCDMTESRKKGDVVPDCEIDIFDYSLIVTNYGTSLREKDYNQYGWREIIFKTIVNDKPGQGYAQKEWGVIQNTNDLEQVYSKLFPNLKWPGVFNGVNFADKTVFYANFGIAKNGGYSNKINQIIEYPNLIKVLIQETIPEPATGCVFDQSTHYPLTVVMIPKTQKQIIVDYSILKTASCASPTPNY